MKLCIYCGTPMDNISLGVAHSDCYWKNRAEVFEEKLKGSEERNKILFDAKNKWAKKVKPIIDIRKAINEYYKSLCNREHGGVAMDNAFHKIEQALGMSWEDYKKNL